MPANFFPTLPPVFILPSNPDLGELIRQTGEDPGVVYLPRAFLLRDVGEHLDRPFFPALWVASGLVPAPFLPPSMSPLFRGEMNSKQAIER